MKIKEQKMRILQNYGQSQWHSQAFLLANRDGLLALKGAIDRILETDNKSDYVNSYVSDGEGYTLLIGKVDSEKGDEIWNEIDLPYDEEIAKSKETKHPIEFIEDRTVKESRKW